MPENKMENKMTAEMIGDLKMRFLKRVKAPLALVWKVHTEKDQLARWWGPEGFSITTHEIDIRTGGSWKLTMHGPDGKDWPNRMWYKEVKEPHVLDYDHGDFDKPHFHVRTELSQDGDFTLVDTVMNFKTREQRDETAKFAVEGHASTTRRLEALLAEIQ